MVINYLKICWQIKYFLSNFWYWNFKMELCLNRGLVWEFLGWKLIILTVSFCKITIRWLIYFLILKRGALVLFGLMERSLTLYCQLRFVSIFTPSYLALSVGYNLLPHNSIFKSSSNFFCLDLKIAISVFVILSKILFAFNQLTRHFNSTFTSLFSFLIEFLGHNGLMSLAKWWTLQNFIAWFRSFIYNKNSRGPRTDRWGTPHYQEDQTHIHL